MQSVLKEVFEICIIMGIVLLLYMLFYTGFGTVTSGGMGDNPLRHQDKVTQLDATQAQRGGVLQMIGIQVMEGMCVVYDDFCLESNRKLAYDWSNLSTYKSENILTIN